MVLNWFGRSLVNSIVRKASRVTLCVTRPGYKDRVCYFRKRLSIPINWLLSKYDPLRRLKWLYSLQLDGLVSARTLATRRIDTQSAPSERQLFCWMVEKFHGLQWLFVRMQVWLFVDTDAWDCIADARHHGSCVNHHMVKKSYYAAVMLTRCHW